MIRYFALVPLLVWAWLLLVPSGALAESDSYIVPDACDDGWETCSAAAQGMNVDLIRGMLDGITRGECRNIQSIIVVKNGKLVVEEYFPRQAGDRRERAMRRVSPQEMTSATKSVMSTLIGI